LLKPVNPLILFGFWISPWFGDPEIKSACQPRHASQTCGHRALAFCKHWSGNPEIGADAVAFAESLLIPCC
jgi:hypothetical protein